MKTWLLQNKIVLAITAAVFFGTSLAVSHFRKPGQLDVIEAQAMDMSQMRPPTGAAVVQLATVRVGSIGDAVTYTGSVKAYNEQDISPRIAGTILSLPVYPGDTVRAGQLVAQLDSAEVGAKTDEAAADAQSAQDAAQVALLTHHLHHQAALDQADAEVQAAEAGLANTQDQALSSQDSVADAQALLASAKANADYWSQEILREKKLADAGAVSIADYQDELAQSISASNAVVQANAKLREAQASVAAARAAEQQAISQVKVSQANQRMAGADITIAQSQAQQASANALSAHAALEQAQVVESYTRITSPANGVVIERPVSAGTLVQPGTVILRVAEIDRVRVQANVAVSDIAGIHPGTPVSITEPGSSADRTFGAVVTSVFPSASDETRTAVVEAVVPNADHLLLPGAFVSMRITLTSHNNGVLVPADAIVSQAGQSYVWIAQGAQSAPNQYECVICHIRYSAAQAAQYHYKDPMDGGKLVPVKAGANAAPAPGGLKAHEVEVTVGDSDGNVTQVASDELTDGVRVVERGQAGLSEGAALAPVAWSANGPTSLPTSAIVDQGRTIYKCVKCGLTFSEADAKRDHFIDPMDGGALVPVKP